MIRSAQFLTLAITLLAPVAAEAAPSRVALLGPNDAPVLARLERNVASLKLDMVKGTVTVCTRDVVTRLLNELRVDTAICTDGDQIGVWLKAGDRLVLKESVVLQGSDDRAQELAAARAVMALQALPAKDAGDGTVATAPSTPGGFTIVANGSEAIIQANNGPQASPPSESPAPVADRPPVVPPKQPERVTPRFVLGVGPGIAASRHGGSFAVSAEAEIGVSRYVALVPWLQFVPENRIAEAPLGTASFRPTIFGFGINIPLLPPTSMFVPRLGTGYGILWLHVAPETATAPATPRKPEDLLAPIMYGTVALSVKVAPSFRVVGEGMAGVASNDMVVRIANEKAAHWGVPVAGLSLRGEWVVQ